jgi:hypothetical protein
MNKVILILPMTIHMHTLKYIIITTSSIDSSRLYTCLMVMQIRIFE